MITYLSRKYNRKFILISTSHIWFQENCGSLVQKDGYGYIVRLPKSPDLYLWSNLKIVELENISSSEDLENRIVNTVHHLLSEFTDMLRYCQLIERKHFEP